MGLEDKLEKITEKTVPLYVMIAIMVLTAAPTVISRVLGLPLVLAGEALRIWAAGHIQKNGEVTTSGPYGYIQSPLYLGSFIIMTGLSLMANAAILWIISTIIFMFSYVPRKQKTEWGRLERIFGEQFLKYKDAVPYFIPKSSVPYPEGGKHPWSFKAMIENTEHQTGIVVLVITYLVSRGGIFTS